MLRLKRQQVLENVFLIADHEIVTEKAHLYMHISAFIRSSNIQLAKANYMTSYSEL